MKKFIKGCLITALILITLGLAISLVSVVTGGVPAVWEMIRRGELSWGFSPSTELDWELESQYDIDDVEIFEEEYEVFDRNVDRTKLENTGIEEIQISIGGGRLFIEPSLDENYYIEAENVGGMQAYVKKNKLIVKGLRDAVLTDSLKYDEAKIWLYLPKGVSYEDVKIELGAGKMEIMPITADEIEVSVGAGEIEAEKFDCRELKMDVGAGQIVLEDCVVTEELETSVGAGHIRVSGVIEKDLTADCAMGSTEFIIYGREEDHNYQLSCAAGSIRVGEEEMGTLIGQRNISHGVNSDYELNCAMGSIYVQFVAE